MLWKKIDSQSCYCSAEDLSILLYEVGDYSFGVWIYLAFLLCSPDSATWDAGVFFFFLIELFFEIKNKEISNEHSFRGPAYVGRLKILSGIMSTCQGWLSQLTSSSVPLFKCGHCCGWTIHTCIWWQASQQYKVLYERVTIWVSCNGSWQSFYLSRCGWRWLSTIRCASRIICLFHAIVRMFQV